MMMMMGLPMMLNADDYGDDDDDDLTNLEHLDLVSGPQIRGIQSRL